MSSKSKSKTGGAFGGMKSKIKKAQVRYLATREIQRKRKAKPSEINFNNPITK